MSGVFDPELELLPVLAANLKSKRAFDVGANRGEFTAAMRSAGFSVDSFEPLPKLARLLHKRFAKDSQVCVHQLACSNSDGMTKLHKFSALDSELDTTLFSTLSPHPAYEGLKSSHKIMVRTSRLDSMFPTATKVGLLKIDTEGHDIAVLKGAGDLHPEVILVEFWDENFVFNAGKVSNRPQDFQGQINADRYKHNILFWRRGNAEEYGIIFDAAQSPSATWGNIMFFDQEPVFENARKFLIEKYGATLANY